MTKFQKKIQNALFWRPFSTSISKNEFSAKIRLCQFLDDKIMLLGGALGCTPDM